MEANLVPKRPIVIKYALITAFVLIFYFLIMDFTGLVRYSLLRFLNYPLIAIGIYLAAKEIKHKNHPHQISYLAGIGVGLMVVLLASIMFSAFIAIYAIYIDSSFVNLIWKEPYYDNNVTNGLAMGFYVFAATLISGLVLNLILMQFFKQDKSPDPEE
jgi:hypothetical protein